MARVLVTVTQSWAAVLTNTTGSIYVEKIGDGSLMINDAASDTGALVIRKDYNGLGKQIEQKGSAVTMYAKATGDGWKIITDDGYMVIL